MIPKWNELYENLSKLIKTKRTNNIFGSKELNNKLFTNNNINININNKIPTLQHKFIDNILISNNINNDIEIILEKSKAINDKGYIEPLKKWLIEANF